MAVPAALAVPVAASRMPRAANRSAARAPMRAAPRRRTPVRHVQRARRQPAAALPGFIGGDASGGGGELPEKADVVALVAADPEFAFFAEAIQKAHLAERLARGANWTVFAPNDVAFAATLEALGLSKASLLASKELLDVLVRLHIAPGKVPSKALRPGSLVDSLEGSRLRVRSAPKAAGGISIAGADVLRADIAADNGVVHVVSTVILPEDLAAKRYARTLPGVIPAVGFWDPLGFTDGQSINEVKRLREAEVTHARVAMSAVAGIALQELWRPLFPDVVGPAIIHFQQIPPPFWQGLALGIGAVEYLRARAGWLEPWKGLFRLREEYTPGNLGFDPLGLQRSYRRGFQDARARELAYGRIAMLAVATFVLQEVITAAPVLQITRNWLPFSH